MSSGIATLWLDRPDRGNALSAEAVRALARAFDDALADPATHTVVLRGRGKHFCTGFDLSDLDRETDESLAKRFAALEELLQAVWHAPVRTVALARGRAWGAGADLFAACDLRVAAPDASLRFPGPAFGIVLGTRRLAETIGWGQARPLVTEGATLDAQGALAAGLATHTLEGDEDAWIASRIAPPVPDRATMAGLRAAVRGDHRAADLGSLLASATRPGLVARIRAYREGLAKS